MTKKFIAGMVCIVQCSLGFAAEGASNLKGVWQLSEAYKNGKSITLKQPSATKIYTERHVIYNYYARLPTCLSPALSAGFGSYTIAGMSLSEIFSNESDPAAIGTTLDSTVSVSDDGDSLEKAYQREGSAHREVWTRLE